MQTSLRRHRSRWARPLAWLVVAGLAGAALIGPAAGGALASEEPGSPDFVPNSGHTSSAGLTLTMGVATINCDGDSVNSFSGSFTFSGADAGDHVVIYLAANNGSDASPAGNVQNNEITIDLDGKTSPVSFTLPITSAFTTSKGGILLVFAGAVSGESTYDSKSNSLNCSESTTTTTTEETTTESTGTESSTTGTETTETETTTTESTGTESSTTGTETTTTESTGTESSTTGTETTSTSTGGELGVTGTPGVTPPPTDTFVAPAAPASADGYRLVLLGLATLLALVLLLQPKEATTKR